MAKYILEDMVRAKREKRGIKTISQKEPIEVVKKVKEPVFTPAPKVVEVAHGPARYHPPYTLWFVAILSILFLGFAVSFLFSSAKVAVVPRIEKINLNENFTASSEPVAGGLFFDLVVISDEEKKTIQATEEKDAVIKATGTAVIFNSFSSAPQRLDIDTRLEGSNGKLYKTSAKITVPGMKDGTPGSIEVPIYAVEAGAEYNSGPIDFQILGFKGTPKYDKFQVRTKTGTEIKGGFKGKAPVVSEEEKTTAIAKIKNTLQEDLTRKAREQIPEGFILFKDAVFLSALDSDVTTVYNDDKSITLVQKGTLYGLLFNEKKLAKKIAESVVDKYDGSDIYIPDMEDLVFVLTGDTGVAFSDLGDISFTLSGKTEMVWRVDEEKFKSALLGRSKESFGEIVAKHPNIESAVLKVTPPWRGTIPEDKEEIKITVDYPEGN